MDCSCPTVIGFQAAATRMRQVHMERPTLVDRHDLGNEPWLRNPQALHRQLVVRSVTKPLINNWEAESLSKFERHAQASGPVQFPHGGGRAMRVM